MTNVSSETDPELKQQLDAMRRSTDPSHEVELDARVRRSLARLDHVCDNIDEREDLLRQELENADADTKYAYVRAIASDAFEQWQDLCFILSNLHVATAGSVLGVQLSNAVNELGETLEHLSITGGADNAEASGQDDAVSQREKAMLSKPAEGPRAEPALQAAKLNVVEKVEALHEAIEELEVLPGGSLFVDAAMIGTNALAEHLDGGAHAEMVLDMLAERLAAR